MRVEFYEFGKKKIVDNVYNIHEVTEKSSDGDTDMLYIEYYDHDKSDNVYYRRLLKVDVTCTVDWKLFPEGDCEEI